MVLEEDQVDHRITFGDDLAPSVAVMKEGSYRNLWADEVGHALKGYEDQWLIAEAAIAAWILAWKAHKALEEIPGLIEEVRAMINSPERGADWPSMWTPMKITPTSRVDKVYAILVHWSWLWSKELLIAPPTSVVVAWWADQTVRGYRPGTSPAHARTLASLHTGWLLEHEAEILLHDRATDFHSAIVDAASKVRAFVPQARRSLRKVHPRPCPNCGELAVVAEWARPVSKGDLVEHPNGRVDEAGEPMVVEVVTVQQSDEADIHCTACGYRPPMTASQISRWLS